MTLPPQPPALLGLQVCVREDAALLNFVSHSSCSGQVRWPLSSSPLWTPNTVPSHSAREVLQGLARVPAVALMPEVEPLVRALFAADPGTGWADVTSPFLDLILSLVVSGHPVVSFP